MKIEPEELPGLREQVGIGTRWTMAAARHLNSKQMPPIRQDLPSGPVNVLVKDGVGKAPLVPRLQRIRDAILEKNNQRLNKHVR